VKLTAIQINKRLQNLFHAKAQRSKDAKRVLKEKMYKSFEKEI
jgi:hypothetical protein